MTDFDGGATVRLAGGQLGERGAYQNRESHWLATPFSA
jgi:hypothetical protein